MLPIMLVEDDPISRRMLEIHLKQWKYEFVSAKNGQEAWDIVQHDTSPRLIILDWMMPEMDGIEVCSRIRGRNTSSLTYIIILTSKNNKTDIIEGLNHGADDYLTKPVDTNELRLRIGAGMRILTLYQELENANRQLQRLVNIDDLTQILNRHAVLDRLESELHRVHREGYPLMLAILDIDHFKQINDVYGHQTGDCVLADFAKRLSNALRPYDILGRYGGEEFLLILMGHAEVIAPTSLERLRILIESTPFFHEDLALHVTTSIGGVWIHANTQVTAEEVIRIADKLLYQAKNEGRNRVCITEFSPPQT